MSLKNHKECLCRYGRKCWTLATVTIVLGLCIGVLLGYTFFASSVEKIQYGYQVTEQVRRGEVYNTTDSEKHITGKRVKVGGFLSEIKGFMTSCVQDVQHFFKTTQPLVPSKSTLKAE